MKRFEYQIEILPECDPQVGDFVGRLQKLLDCMGSEGWELCQMFNGKLIFKREVAK